MTSEERFWSKVNKAGPSPAHCPEMGPCHLWTAGLDTNGYGKFRGGDGRTRKAHQVSWEMKHGPFPEGLEPDHLCRIRACVNDAHLEPVTHAENMRRRMPGPRQPAKTHCPAGHPYAGENLYVHPNGSRVCRTCMREAARRHYRAKAFLRSA